MADTLEKQFITAFCDAWGEAVPPLLGRASTLGLLSLREVSGEGLGATLAVAATWSSGFAADCYGTLSGVVLCLFKSEDESELERILKQAADGLPKPGGRTLIKATLAGTAARLPDLEPSDLSFGEVRHIDLSGQEARLAAIIGNQAWVGTFSLNVGTELETQALLLYAPQGSLEALKPATPAETQAAAPPLSSMPAAASASTSAPAGSVSRRNSRREEAAPRNLERLLGVELEVIVRFGLTELPLREVVRLGPGMMIELNRSVDEPVELLVNGRPLARGEVVVIDGYYGVRITEIGVPSERSQTLLSSGD